MNRYMVLDDEGHRMRLLILDRKIDTVTRRLRAIQAHALNLRPGAVRPEQPFNTPSPTPRPTPSLPGRLWRIIIKCFAVYLLYKMIRITWPFGTKLFASLKSALLRRFMPRKIQAQRAVPFLGLSWLSWDF